MSDSKHEINLFSDSLNEYTFDRKTQDDLTDVFTIFGGSRSKAEKIFKEYDEDKLKKAPSYLEATFVMPDLILETYSLPKNADGAHPCQSPDSITFEPSLKRLITASISAIVISAVSEELIVGEFETKIPYLWAASTSI